MWSLGHIQGRIRGCTNGGLEISGTLSISHRAPQGIEKGLAGHRAYGQNVSTKVCIQVQNVTCSRTPIQRDGELQQWDFR